MGRAPAGTVQMNLERLELDAEGLCARLHLYPGEGEGLQRCLRGEVGRKGLAGLWDGKTDLGQKPGGNLLTLEAHLGGKILEEPWHRVELKHGHRQETKGQLKTLATDGEGRSQERRPR